MAGLFEDVSRETAANVLAAKAVIRGNMERRLKQNAPVRTGKLRRSIKVKQDFDLEMEDYGYIQNDRGRHQGWIDRSI